MAIKKVQLPDNSTQDINDARIASSDISAWNAQESFYFVDGSSSAAGNGTSGSYLSTKWEGTVSGITTPTDGMKIAFRIATNTGVATAGAVLSIDGGTTYHPVVYNVNSVISTRYSVGSTVLLVYNSTQTATAYLTSNTKTTVTGCWQIMDYSASNTDTKVRQYQSGANAAGTSPEYPLLSRYGTTNVNGSYEANYARFHTGATLNTSTGGITAASFKKTGGTSSQFLKADGSVDSNTYLTTAPVTSVNGSTGDVTVSVPTKTSDLTNDSGFITGYTETDPVFAASAAHGITSSDISNWNGKQDALVSGTNIKTVNNESLLGSGNISVTGQSGDDGVGIASVVQTTESTVSGGTNVITVTKTDGTTSTFNVRNGDAVGLVVVSQERGTSTTATMSQDSITKELDAITNYKREVENAYVYVTWEYGRLDTDGTITTGYGAVSELLPVIPNETISLNSIAVVKVAYFDKNKSFLSIVSMSSGMNDYTVPSNAYYARYQHNSDGGPAYFKVRKRTFENKSFSDLILSPLKTTISIGFTGDSNTTGYGVTDSKSWANLMSDALTAITSVRFDVNSSWVDCLGYKEYSDGVNMQAGSIFGINTDATSITLEYDDNYSSAWNWYVDGAQTGTASSTTLTLDGSLHRVEARFTAGQLTVPRFIIPKTITCSNDALFGAAIQNMPFVSGYDWLFIMIGTNHRTQYYANGFKFGQYSGKGTYIVPFPNHRSESNYTISQLQAYTYEMDIFRNIGYDVLNLSDFNAAPFYDNTYYQGDGIHFNAAGHRVIANMVSGHLGLPLCLQVQ